MERIRKLNKNFTFNFLLVTLAFLLTAVAVIMGAYVQEGYQLSVGSVSPVRFTAPRTVENTVATQRKRDEAARSADPLYKLDAAVKEQALTSLESFFTRADQQRKDNAAIPASLNEDGTADTPAPTPNPGLLSHLNQSDYDLLMEIPENLFQELKTRAYAVADVAFNQGIEEVDAKVLLFVKGEFINLGWDVALQNLGYEIVTSYLQPNRILDEEATQRAREERAAAVEPVFFIKNQNIVNEGEIITEEAYQALDSLGLVSKAYAENILSILGVVLIIGIIFFVLISCINSYHKNLVLNKKEALLLFTLYVSMVVLSWALIGVSYQFLPLLVFAMLVSMLFHARLAIALNIGMCMISLLIIKGDVEFLLFYLITGTSIALSARNTTERSKIIMVGFRTSLINFSVMLGIALIFEKNYSQTMLVAASYAALNGIFSVIISIGTLPFWEAVFEVITPIKLLDLTNPNSVPLRRLAIEAPGTYHHSLIVANLAEAAAYDIGANPNIARVGGYYHDIGKVKYPQYFTENQVGENPHDFMDPLSSVQVIVSHVTFGLELAEAAKLPKIIRDMIEQHHGNTLIKYFYYKVKKERPDEEIAQDAFRYHRQCPQFKEAAILMLADTIEAAVRSMLPADKSSSEIEAFVRELIKDKMDDGQLLDSTLTIKDLEMITSSFVRVLKGMYHERIPYPKNAKSEKS